MIVDVEEEVFTAAGDDLDLYQLIRLGFQERHYILIDPPFQRQGRGPVNQWIARHERPLRVAIEEALDFGMEAEVTGPSPRPRTRIRVAKIARPNWDLAVPVLPLGDACRLLETPLRLLVENRRSDGAFLRAYAKPEQRERLARAERNGWLEIVQGGGLGEILQRVREEMHDPMHALRLWVMFDSDAREPFDPDSEEVTRHGPSQQSRLVQSACKSGYGRLGKYAHQLRRRSIESYIPAQVLREWTPDAKKRAKNAKKRAKEAKKRQRKVYVLPKVHAFLSMSDAQRYHFNMKEGFKGDRKQGSPGISPLFTRTGVDRNEHLQAGFPGLADFFYEEDFKIRQEWIREELKELEPIIDSIFERM